MNNTELCLNLINNIDDSVLLSEGYVLSKQIALSEKVETMFSIMGDTVEMYMTEASVGTGIKSFDSDSILRKLWDFMRRVVRSIINKISDLLTKLKIRNYSYVEMPMSFADMSSDVELLNQIQEELSKTVNHDKEYDADYSKEIENVRQILLKTKQFKILKATAKDKSGAKPDQFMKLRDRLRFINTHCSNMEKRLANDVRKLNNAKNVSESFKQYSQECQKVFAELVKVSTKLFSSFKFGGATKASDEIVAKLVNTRNKLKKLLSKKQVVESYYDTDIEDYDFFDETEKPYDQYLKNHNYDPKTNTIEIKGKRVNAGKIPSKKEQNRINRFLRENKYDPKTETIQTDVKGKDGKNNRIKFNMFDELIGEKIGPAYYASPNGDYGTYQINEPTIYTSKEVLGQKPRTSNQLYKHEEGHYNQDTHGKINLVAGRFEPRDENKTKTKKFIDKNSDVDNSHFSSGELDADLYGYQHNPYSSKDKGNKSQLGSMDKIVKKEAKAAKKAAIDEFNGRHEKISQDEYDHAIGNLEWKIDLCKSDIKWIEDLIISSNKRDAEFNERFPDLRTESIDSMGKLLIQRMEDLNELNEDLQILKKEGKNSPRLKSKISEMEAIFDDNVEDIIDIINTAIEENKKEFKARDAFLDENKNEASSQARKLEGRQGKHKGKK